MIRNCGAIFVFLSCGYVGFLMASNHMKEIKTLRTLIGVLDYMECELEYHMTPLPELCRKASMNCNGMISELFLTFADELDMQVAPNVSQCMHVVVSKRTDVSTPTKEVLTMMGDLLGNFDLNGQIKGLQSVRAECNRLLKELDYNKDARVRGYQALGLCAGAAIAIVLL